MATVFENAVITKSGLLLQSKLVTGGTLQFTRVKTGSGTVDPEELEDQTDVTGVKQSLTFSSRPTYRDNGTVQIKFAVQNDGVQTSYDMHQIGLFAKETDGSEILYAILQGTVPVNVPSQSELDGWTAEFNVGVTYSNASEVTVVVDSTETMYHDNVFMIGPDGKRYFFGLDEKGVYYEEAQ